MKTLVIECPDAKFLEKILLEMPEDVDGSVRESLLGVCGDLKGKAQRLAPYRHGGLRGSAFYETSIDAAGHIQGTVGFTMPYAARQHEEMDYRHTDGQAKYLEQPLKENSAQYVDSIAEACRKVVERTEGGGV